MNSPSQYVAAVSNLAQEYLEKAKDLYEGDAFDDAKDAFYDELEDMVLDYGSGEIDTPSSDELTRAVAGYMDEETGGPDVYKRMAAFLDDGFDELDGLDELDDEYKTGV